MEIKCSICKEWMEVKAETCCNGFECSCRGQEVIEGDVVCETCEEAIRRLTDGDCIIKFEGYNLDIDCIAERC